MIYRLLISILLALSLGCSSSGGAAESKIFSYGAYDFLIRGGYMSAETYTAHKFPTEPAATAHYTLNFWFRNGSWCRAVFRGRHLEALDLLSQTGPWVFAGHARYGSDESRIISFKTVEISHSTERMYLLKPSGCYLTSFHSQSTEPTQESNCDYPEEFRQCKHLITRTFQSANLTFSEAGDLSAPQLQRIVEQFDTIAPLP